MKVFPYGFLFALVVSLMACSNTPVANESSQVRMPIGVGFGISDISCQEFKQYILPTRLNALGVTFEWTDEYEGLLTAGPIIEEVQPESKFTRMRRIFFLSITCVDELTTQIVGEVSIEGYNDSDEWISITEPAIVEKYGLQFLQELTN